MTSQLEKMICDYKNSGERVDEVLFQEVTKAIERVHFLEKSEEGYRQNWHKCIANKESAVFEIRCSRCNKYLRDSKEQIISPKCEDCYNNNV